MSFKEPVTLLPSIGFNKPLARRSLWKSGRRWTRALALSAHISYMANVIPAKNIQRAWRLAIFWALGTMVPEREPASVGTWRLRAEDAEREVADLRGQLIGRAGEFDKLLRDYEELRSVLSAMATEKRSVGNKSEGHG